MLHIALSRAAFFACALTATLFSGCTSVDDRMVSAANTAPVPIKATANLDEPLTEDDINLPELAETAGAAFPMAAAPEMTGPPPGVVTPIRPGQDHFFVRVFYGTNRQRREDDQWTAERGPLQFGQALVSIPKSHQTGTLESPSILRLEFVPDPKKHVVYQRATQLSEDDFRANIRTILDQGPDELLLFLHGYNVTFESAARRTAQLAYDLQFPGVPVFFSWPSRGSLFNWHANYTPDYNRAEASVPDLAAFLQVLAGIHQVDEIHVIAHSMGNKLLWMTFNSPELQDATLPIGQLILAAPDMDRDRFIERAGADFAARAERVTLYCTEDDKALKAAEAVWGGQRAGNSRPEPAVVPGIETVDIQNFTENYFDLQHSNYGDCLPVVLDIRQIVTRELSALNRQLLPQTTTSGLAFYTIPE